MAYLEEEPNARWPHSYAYADSYTDIPLLERAGHPAAVYPDPQLAAHAHSQGWEIIEIPVNYRPRLGGQSKISGTMQGTILATYFILYTILKYSRTAEVT